MEENGRWSLFGAVIYLLFGIFMLVDGIGPEWYSYVTVVLAFTAAVVWTVRYVRDVREARGERARSGGVVSEAIDSTPMAGGSES